MQVEIRSVTRSYGRIQALRGVDLTIGTGMFGLLGPNGAGKTTLMRILAGVIRPSAGQVRVGPFDMATREGRVGVKRTLGYLPQELGLYPDLTGAQFLDYVSVLKGLDDTRRRRVRVEELLETVGLADAARRRLKAYSGGMKRRIGIAQALVSDPKLLIVDEPTAGLDPEERIRFRTLLVRLAGDRTVVLSTHIVEDIAQTCRRVGVIERGQVVFEGDIEGLVGRAAGRVWTVATEGPAPGDSATIVSAVQEGVGMRYRVVAEAPPPDASPSQPGLEDGYVALMRDIRTPHQDPVTPVG
jgi:ABC-type multidrug transport system ATPase subunit